MPRTPGVPTYRRRVVRGHEIAVVTLYDQATGKRRDCWLGEYGSPESRARYARLLTQWEAAGRRLPGRRPPLRPTAGPTVTEVVAAYWPTVVARVSAPHAANLRPLLRRWREHYGRQLIAEITPSMLREWRATLAREVSIDVARRANGPPRGLLRTMNTTPTAA